MHGRTSHIRFRGAWLSAPLIALSMVMAAGLMWLTAPPASAQVTTPPDLEWINLGGHRYNPNGGYGWQDESFSMDVDSAGNTYLTVGVIGNARFTSTTGVNPVTLAPGGAILLAKYNPAGELLWVETVAQDESWASESEVAVDAAGNVFVVGLFENSQVFGSGASAVTLSSQGRTDIFIAKFDAAGDLLWAKSEGRSDYDLLGDVGTDAAGNLFLAATSQAQSAADFSLYLSKYNPNGGVIWSETSVDVYASEVTEMHVEDSGEVWLTGYTYFGARIGEGSPAITVSSRGQSDMFVAKFDTLGQPVWAATSGGTDHDKGHDLVVDPQGNVYGIGEASTSLAVIDSTSTTHAVTTNGAVDAVLWKVNPNGIFEWAVPIESPSSYTGHYSIGVGNGTVAVVGKVGWRSTTFRSADGSTPSVTLGSTSPNSEAVLVIWDSEGTLVQASSLAGTDLYSSSGIEFGPDGGLHIVGRINPSLNEPISLPTDGMQDLFVAKVATAKLCRGLPVTVDLAAGESPTNGDDVILGTAGSDVIDARGGNDTICAGAGNDRVIGGDGADTIDAGAGSDTVWGGAGADTIWGYAGIDRIRGGSGDDTIWGGADRDVILGDGGLDMIYGDAGRDSLYGGGDADTIDGGPDTDLVRGQDGNDTLYTGLSGNDRLVGGAGDDTLDGRATTGSTRMLGEGGDDTFYGSEQLDRMWGGDGNDTMYGRGYNDLLRGGNGNDKLYGQDGRDTLDGGVGNDQLFGGAGNADKMVGMNGVDTCVGGSGVDDFAHATCEAVA